MKKKKKDTNFDKLKVLRDKPFWIWDQEKHLEAFMEHRISKYISHCCFNHIVGLPIKNGKRRPLYPYQKDIYDLTDRKIKAIKNKGIFIEKATGLGVSEFYLRFMGWLATCNDKYAKSKFCIVTGPNVDIATGLMDRLKEFFMEGLGIVFDDSVYVCTLNKVSIEAFPSGNLDAMRGLPDVKFILLDEADFFPENKQRDARTISERYIAKSNPVIVMVSTPNPDESQNGLYVKMNMEFDEAEKRGTLDDMIYTRLRLPYSVAVGTMFTEQEIEAAKKSPSFETEYNLQRSYDSGNLLLPETIVLMKDLGFKYGDDSVDTRETYVGPTEPFQLISNINDIYVKKDIHYDTPLFVPTFGSVRVMGIDGAFGSSNFGISIVELVDDEIIRVLYAEEFNRIEFDSAISRCDNLIRFYGIKRVYIDSANPEVVGAIRKLYGESHDYNLDSRPKNLWSGYPVSFGSEGRPLLAKLQRIATTGKLAIHPKWEDLLIQLGIAKHRAYDLIKLGALQLDTLDSLRLALKHFAFE